MPFVLQKTKSGLSTLEINGRFLHSNYAPDKEAFRFVSRLNTDDSPNWVIIFGAGIGYLVDAVKKIYPYARIFSIYLNHHVYSEACKNRVNSDCFWHPESCHSLSDCLDLSIKDYDFKRIKVIKWGPSIQAFAKMAKKAADILNQCLNQIKGSINTIQGFGKKWISNSFINYLTLPTIISSPIILKNKFPVLAASGPSLIKSLNFIIENRMYIQLIALPSSLSVLSEYNLTPDIVVVTDPGFYSAYHFRFHKNNPPVIAMPLSAVPGLQKHTQNFYIFQQPHFFEIQLLQTLNRPFQSIDPQGTVAASALALILSQTAGPCLVTGLDLAFRDIHSHAYPNSFYNIHNLKSNRMNPLLLNLFKNAIHNTEKIFIKNLRCSQSLRLYADFFNRMPDQIKSRLFITDEQPMLKGFKIFNSDSLSVKQYNSDSLQYKMIKNLPAPEVRCKMALNLLNKWQNLLTESSSDFRSELDELYFFVNVESYMQIKHDEQYQSKIESLNKINALNIECLDFISLLKNKVNSIKEKQ